MFGLRKSRVQRIDPCEAVARHARGDLTVIDVREAAELRASGTARGALHVPLALLPIKADPRHPGHDPALDPDRPVALYCAAGGRSGMAAELLMKLGYREVYNIGGFGDWCAGGGQTCR
ncbi:rhodanese-like domain-containing protein [Ruixingdingia sedimenti]|uniref:Rhodanese-like domain-containing protein n=1 Tax=Ruixingdingia sedimenti TaxID=3073604 RepID=A0ABU1F399_9RHOB|nr:rhodanese-like domain-containing protein [Xinfangfangia sp. LG-4]MDR5651340.1 rhodanese-like domain-containing protein [Xinfangfangia sp. LG-4]